MSIRKNIIYNFILTGSSLLFPLLTFPYLSRILGAQGLGITNFVFSYCQNYIIVANLGLLLYGSREIAKLGDDKQNRSQLFFDLLILHLLFTLLVLIIYTISLFLYQDFKNYMQLTVLGGVYILLNAFTIEWLYQGVSDFKYITLRSVVVRSLSVVFIFIFVKHEEDFTLYFFILVVTFFLTSFLNMIYARKYISKHVTFSIKKIFAHIKPVIILGIYIVFNSVTGQVAPTLLGFLSTKIAVGYYYAANKIVMLVVSGFFAVTQVMFPEMNRILGEQKNEEYDLLLKKLIHVVINIGIPLSFIIYLLAKPLVILLGGVGFINSIVCVQIMSPVILIVALAQIFVLLILTVHRKDKEIAIISFIGLIVALAINLIFIQRFEERASSAARLIVELVKTGIAFYLAKKILQFHFPVKLFLQNLIFVLPYILIARFWLNLTDKVVLELLFSGISFGLYFLFYQLLFIKDEYLMELVGPYIKKVKRLF